MHHLILLIGDLWCALRHQRSWMWLAYGSAVCGACDREWQGTLCVSRAWKADMEKLAAPEAEEGD